MIPIIWKKYQITEWFRYHVNLKSFFLWIKALKISLTFLQLFLDIPKILCKLFMKKKIQNEHPKLKYKIALKDQHLLSRVKNWSFFKNNASSSKSLNFFRFFSIRKCHLTKFLKIKTNEVWHWQSHYFSSRPTAELPYRCIFSAEVNKINYHSAGFLKIFQTLQTDNCGKK